MHLREYAFSKFPGGEGGGSMPPDPPSQRHTRVGVGPKYPPIIARFPPFKNFSYIPGWVTYVWEVMGVCHVGTQTVFFFQWMLNIYNSLECFNLLMPVRPVMKNKICIWLSPKDQQIDAKELQRCLTSSGISGNYQREYGTDCIHNLKLCKYF